MSKELDTKKHHEFVCMCAHICLSVHASTRTSTALNLRNKLFLLKNKEEWQTIYFSPQRM